MDKVEALLECYPDLEELFEVLDIEPYDVVCYLLRKGMVKLPPFLDDEDDGQQSSDEE